MYSGYKCKYVCREEHDVWLSLTTVHIPEKKGNCMIFGFFINFPTHINFINCQHFDYSALKKTVVKMLVVDEN